MSYDPLNWLLSANRALRDYIAANLDPDFFAVELNFPDTEKLIPLPKTLIHIEQDAMEHPVMGFGTPGVEIYDANAGTWILEEAQPHLLNFDLGVWASRESGGATSRMEAVQTLSDLFARPEGKKAFDATVGGMWVVNFMGGRNELDRINDVPVWRALDMTLIVRVVSKHVPAVAEIVPTDANQDQELTISDDSGAQVPVT